MAISCAKTSMYYSKSQSKKLCRSSFTPKQINKQLRKLVHGAECPFVKPVQCDESSPYRSIDGSCNNLKNPFLGAANTPFRRLLPAAYEDGVSVPREFSTSGNRLPNARLVSITVFQNSQPTDRSRGVSKLGVIFGQYLAHDFVSMAAARGVNDTEINCCSAQSRKVNRRFCFPIDIPTDDPFFRRDCMELVRALPSPPFNCLIGPEDKINQLTDFIDASGAYGSHTATTDRLREFLKGLMKVTTDNLLPPDVGGNSECESPTAEGNFCYDAGDVRVDENIALSTIHTLFVREHNRIAKILSDVNPHWNDERLFQVTRKIHGAMLQHIVYREFLKVIIGKNALKKNNLRIKRNTPLVFPYDDTLDVRISDAFNSAAWRFGHSMLDNFIRVASSCPFGRNIALSKTLMSPDILYQPNAFTGLLRGISSQRGQSADRFVTREITNRLFETDRKTRNGNDLIAINIQRGRDNGLSSYNDYRELCGLTRAKEFTTSSNGFYNHKLETVKKLADVYKHPDDVELFPGGISEIPVSDGALGPTFVCIIGRQFRNLRFGDRFWYERNTVEGFTKDQIKEIKKATMAGVILHNSNVDSIQRNVFRPASVDNEHVICDDLPSVDFSKWMDGAD